MAPLAVWKVHVEPPSVVRIMGLELGPRRGSGLITPVQVLSSAQDKEVNWTPLLSRVVLIVQLAPPSVVRTTTPESAKAMQVLISGQAILDRFGPPADCWIQVIPPSVVLRIRE